MPGRRSWYPGLGYVHFVQAIVIATLSGPLCREALQQCQFYTKVRACLGVVCT